MGANIMKKMKLLFLSLLSFSLIACSSNDNDSKKERQNSVEVDKGLLTVEVTIPASFYEGENVNVEEIITEAEKDGVKKVTKNEDGSLTYKMSKSQHKKMLKDMESEIQQTIKEIESNEDFTSIDSIKSNQSYDEFTLSVNQSEYENSMDGFATLGLAMQSMFYQLFSGVDEEDYQVTIHLMNKDTSKVFDTVVYPDALEALEKNKK